MFPAGGGWVWAFKSRFGPSNLDSGPPNLDLGPPNLDSRPPNLDLGPSNLDFGCQGGGNVVKQRLWETHGEDNRNSRSDSNRNESICINTSKNIAEGIA